MAVFLPQSVPPGSTRSMFKLKLMLQTCAVRLCVLDRFDRSSQTETPLRMVFPTQICETVTVPIWIWYQCGRYSVPAEGTSWSYLHNVCKNKEPLIAPRRISLNNINNINHKWQISTYLHIYIDYPCIRCCRFHRSGQVENGGAHVAKPKCWTISTKVWWPIFLTMSQNMSKPCDQPES